MSAYVNVGVIVNGVMIGVGLVFFVDALRHLLRDRHVFGQQRAFRVRATVPVNTPYRDQGFVTHDFVVSTPLAMDALSHASRLYPDATAILVDEVVDPNQMFSIQRGVVYEKTPAGDGAAAQGTSETSGN